MNLTKEQLQEFLGTPQVKATVKTSAYGLVPNDTWYHSVWRIFNHNLRTIKDYRYFINLAIEELEQHFDHDTASQLVHSWLFKYEHEENEFNMLIQVGFNFDQALSYVYECCRGWKF